MSPTATEAKDAVLTAADAVFHETGSDAFGRCCRIWRAALERDDESYLRDIAGLSRETLGTLTMAFAVLSYHFAVKGSFEDVLGAAYMDVRSRWGKSRLGQYFTPWSVAVCMAQMVMHDHDGPPPSVCDPCVGAGITLLAARHVVNERWGVRAVSAMVCHGQDIDAVCVDMSKIQLNLSAPGLFFAKVCGAITEARA